MEIQEIEVYIEKTGNVVLTVRGAKGQKCLPLTQELEQALGNKILSRQMTSEATEIVEHDVSQQQRQSI